MTKALGLYSKLMTGQFPAQVLKSIKTILLVFLPSIDFLKHQDFGYKKFENFPRFLTALKKIAFSN